MAAPVATSTSETQVVSSSSPIPALSTSASAADNATTASSRARLRGRAFYESIGSPKYVLAPMVDQSEFAWRMLSRSFLESHEQRNLLAYSPMFHARLFGEGKQFRDNHFRPVREGLAAPPLPSSQIPAPQHDYLDGRPDIDRPLTVQFCANDSNELLVAARYVQPYCDAVDLNLGCPQGIARKGHYGAFLQEDWDLVASLISTLNSGLAIPVTAKIRILETKEKTLQYAKRIVDAGASILTVHGRLREQKSHLTGLADWSVIRYLRDNLPPELVMFANGNILRHEDIQRCLDATGVDGVMSAEGNLSDPTIFARPPPPGQEGREYWRGRDGKGGYRMDAVFRRYLDIIYKHVLERPTPQRKPLFLLSDPRTSDVETAAEASKDSIIPGTLKRTQEAGDRNDQSRKKRKREGRKTSDPSLSAMQPHLFHMLRPLVAVHTNVRDALGRSRGGEIEAFEHVLALTEEAVKQGMLDYEADPSKYEVAEPSSPSESEPVQPPAQPETTQQQPNDHESSLATVRACKRPYWVLQPYVRPLPKEALEKGAVSLSKKELKKMKLQEDGNTTASKTALAVDAGEGKDKTNDASGHVDVDGNGNGDGTGRLDTAREQAEAAAGLARDEIPKEAMVAG